MLFAVLNWSKITRLKLNWYKSYILLGTLFFGTVCNAQNSDQGFLKRNWDNMIARYNVYFNATLKFNEATTDLFERQKDDFEQFIEVYPYGTEADAASLRAPMEEVMKKASKVIQNKPHSKWVDDSYFLIGQTHFFSNDPFSAIESFQFVYSHYSDPYIKAKSQLWVMKSYILQEKYNDAEAILALIRADESSFKKIKISTHLVAGDLFVKLGKYQSAVDELEQGVKYVKDRQLKYRTHFLLGQLYLELKQYEKATEHFLKVIKMNSPYEYVFQSNLGMTKATAESGGKGIKSTQKNLKRMLKDDKNIDYFDQIYYELALLEFVQGNEEAGLNYLFQSSANAGTNAKQKTKTYLYLADYFFNKRVYAKSQAYFDSAVSVLPKDYPDYDKISARHAVLSKLIENIQTIQIQDSLLALAALPKDQLDRKIQKIIEEQRRQERLAAEEEELQRQRDLLNTGTPDLSDPTGASSGVWYFYNAAQIGRGANDFIKLWGKREHTDWWRYANKSVMEASSGSADPETNEDPLTYDPEADTEQQEILASIDEELRKYYENIPFSATAKLIANKKVQDALLAVSKVYFDDLKEYAKTKENINILFAKYPETPNKAEALFYLAKAYKALGDTNTYAQYALQIANEYPNTPYNQVLNNREVVESGEDQEVLDLYTEMYNAYNSENYTRVKEIKDLVAKEYAGNSIQAKFDYLYALTVGKTQGKDAYIAELQAVADNYPGTDIAGTAAYTVNLLSSSAVDPSMDISMFTHNVNEAHFYVLLGKTSDTKKIEAELSEYNSKFFPGETFIIKTIEYNELQLFYLKPLKDKDQAHAYHLEMKNNHSFLEVAGLSELQYFAISESNFKTLIRLKNEDAYLAFFAKYFPSEL